MKEDLALSAVEHASTLGAEYVDVKLEDHISELVIVADCLFQCRNINANMELV